MWHSKQYNLSIIFSAIPALPAGCETSPYISSEDLLATTITMKSVATCQPKKGIHICQTTFFPWHTIETREVGASKPVLTMREITMNYSLEILPIMLVQYKNSTHLQ